MVATPSPAVGMVGGGGIESAQSVVEGGGPLDIKALVDATVAKVNSNVAKAAADNVATFNESLSAYDKAIQAKMAS